MNVQVVGCSHHSTSIAIRERLAFRAEQTGEALDHWRRVFRETEAVLLSTCNRVEVYAAGEAAVAPSGEQVAGFLARFHKLDPTEVAPHLYHYAGQEAVRHLFTVAASLDSMVVGEPQILAQVKEAYQAAVEHDNAGPLLHAAFQAAIHVARRVAAETTIHQRRVSIPSVAVADFAQQIFERFDDKQTLVIGGGEMAEETLRYLCNAGVRRITVVNRHFDRASQLAGQWSGLARPWEELPDAIAEADLVISTTASGGPIVSADAYRRIEASRGQRPLFVLDLAVPRDFDPAIGRRPEVFLYSIDDLQAACQRNRQQRDKELPVALRIIDQEAERFMGDLYHRATGPVIRQLKEGWRKPKEEELQRLLGKLPELDARQRAEVRRSFDRLLNKLLHPPLESLRDESRHGIPHVLLDALARLFQLKD
jgi:glutamyl-tRNA reductase